MKYKYYRLVNECERLILRVDPTNNHVWTISVDSKQKEWFRDSTDFGEAECDKDAIEITEAAVFVEML